MSFITSQIIFRHYYISCVGYWCCFNSGLTEGEIESGFKIELRFYKFKSTRTPSLIALHLLLSPPPLCDRDWSIFQLASPFTSWTIKGVHCWSLHGDGWRTTDLQCSAIVRAKQALITARRTIDIITFQSAGPQWHWAAINWDEWSVDDNFHNRYTFRNSSR